MAFFEPKPIAFAEWRAAVTFAEPKPIAFAEPILRVRRAAGPGPSSTPPGSSRPRLPRSGVLQRPGERDAADRVAWAWATRTTASSSTSTFVPLEPLLRRRAILTISTQLDGPLVCYNDPDNQEMQLAHPYALFARDATAAARAGQLYDI